MTGNTSRVRTAPTFRNMSFFCHLQVPEINGFLTAGRKKNGEVEDELDRSLEGMDHSDDQFDKGKGFASIPCECSVVLALLDLTMT